MSYQDDRIYALNQEIQDLDNMKRKLRYREKSLWARNETLKNMNQFPNANPRELKRSLEDALSPFMMPSNIGGISDVSWMFMFQITIDVGTDPTIGPSLIANPNSRGSFQVDQESCALIQAISTSYMTDAANLSAMKDAPVQLDLIDRQSSRRFNSGPIPLQMLGYNSNPSVLPTSMLLLPNAFFDIQLSSMSPTDIDYTGSGQIQFSFYTARTRIENAGKVMSTTFAGA